MNQPQPFEVPDFDVMEKAVEALMEELRVVLRGKDPTVTGCALAEATARWACGHIRLGDIVETRKFQQDILGMQIHMTQEIYEALRPEYEVEQAAHHAAHDAKHQHSEGCKHGKAEG